MKKIMVLLMGLFLFSCGGSNVNVDDITSQEKDFVYSKMQDVYFWNNQTSQINVNDYSTAEDLLDAMMYTPEKGGYDKWSYIETQEEYNSWYEEGKGLGLGYRYYWTDNNKISVRFGYVYKNSPADLAGIKRGDTLLAINGISVTDIEKTNNWETITGKDEEGIEVNFKILSSGIEKNLLIKKAYYTRETVCDNNIFTVGGKKIGYFNFLNFLDSSESELDNIFSNFKNNGVSELVLDVRYNGGGKIHIANHLGSLIGGNNVIGKNFINYLHNSNKSNWNKSETFEDVTNSLNLKKVYIITSSSSASASELLINGLKPYIDVIIIGDKTYGKPVGMYNWEFSDKVIVPICFKTTNANGEGDYYSGIDAQYYVGDNFDYQIGEQNEPRVKTALDLITGNTSSKTLKRSYKNEEIELGIFGKKIETGI